MDNLCQTYLSNQLLKTQKIWIHSIFLFTGLSKLASVPAGGAVAAPAAAAGGAAGAGAAPAAGMYMPGTS